MVAASMYAGEGWHDHPKCVPPTIRYLCVGLNDMLPDGEREKVIGPHLFTVLGRDSSAEAEKKRAMMIADWAVEMFCLTNPITCDWAKKWLSGEDKSEAAADASADAAAWAADAAAWAARAAAWAARAAARAAAMDAAEAAAWAADAAAESAARTARADQKSAAAIHRSLLDLILRLCEVGEQKHEAIDRAKMSEVMRTVCLAEARGNAGEER